MHQLPHLYPWVKRQSGVSKVGIMELGGAIRIHSTARFAFSANRAAEFKVSTSAKRFCEVRLSMKTTGWISRLFNQQSPPARIQRFAASGVRAAAFLVGTGMAVAQNPTPGPPPATPDAQMV